MIDKEEKIKRKKKIITDALKRCLVRDVYSRITVQEIADEAGFSKGGILHYFPTKEDIYLELIKEIFTGFERAHADILKCYTESEVMAPLSALLGVESFILDKTNLRIIVNLILFALEEERIMRIIREFVRKHYDFYKNVIYLSSKSEQQRRKSDIDAKYLSRMAQTIIFFIGIIELIDPIEIDYVEVVRYVTDILKG